MESYLIYIGKSALAAGAFYLVYLALFQNQKQFVFNRIYLPVSFLLSFAIPLITFTTIKYVEPAEPVNYNINSFVYLPEAGEIVESEFIYQWYHYLFGIYALGSIVFLSYLILGHVKASNIIRNSWLKILFGVQVNITPKDVHPFSFFNKIVVSEKTLRNPNLGMIVYHERIHVKEKHTFDILFTEVLFLFQWFNPFAWLIKDAIKNNLEYKTDHQVTKRNNAEAYQLAMVGLADKKGVAPFLTALNGSQLKNRIMMMKKKTENKFAFLKQLFVLPLLAVLVMGLSNKEVKTETIKPSEVRLNQTIKPRKVDFDLTQKKESAGQVTLEVHSTVEGQEEVIRRIALDHKLGNVHVGPVYHYVDEMPTFPGGDKALREFIYSNLRYPEIALEKEIWGDAYVTFIIDTNGKVIESRISAGVDPSLDKEALRVVNSLPEWIPGKKDGENVNTWYTIPINFRIIEKKGLSESFIIKQNKGTGISGKVTDINDIPINRASVFVRDKTLGTRTDESGNYFIETEEKNGTLIFFHRGTRAEVEINNRDRIDIKLNTEFTNPLSIGTIYDGSLKLRNKEDKMVKPLFIIDGREVEIPVNLTPNDKVSTSILTNELAESFYGEKGKNGVVQIATKNWKFPSNANPLIIVDGEEFYGSVEDIPKEKIYHVTELRYPNLTQKYGDKGKDGVVIIRTTRLQSVSTLMSTEKRDPNHFAYFSSRTDLKSIEKINQKYRIKGKVTDEKGNAIPGVSVIIKGINVGTITNKEGYYELKYDSVIETLIFAIKGQAEKEIKVDGKTVINVVFESDGDPKSRDLKTTGYTGQSSVKIQNTGLNTNFDENPPLFIIDGNIVDKTVLENLDSNTINDITVLKDSSATTLYGKQAKNGVILINTKGYTGQRKGELPVVLNGKMTGLTLAEVDRDLIKHIDRVEPGEAVKKYGEKGINGVFEVTSRKLYTDKIIVKSSEELAKENEKITSELELRKFIAKEIKYPKEVVDAGVSGTVTIIASINKKGNLSVKDKPSYPDLRIDEVVVVAYAPKQKMINTEETNMALYNELKKEAERVVKSIPNIRIDEFKGKSIGIIVKFLLQE